MGSLNRSLVSFFCSDDLKRKINEEIMNHNNDFFICGDLNSRHRKWCCTRANILGDVLNKISTFFPVTILHRNILPEEVYLFLCLASIVTKVTFGSIPIKISQSSQALIKRILQWITKKLIGKVIDVFLIIP